MRAWAGWGLLLVACGSPEPTEPSPAGDREPGDGAACGGQVRSALIDGCDPSTGGLCGRDRHCVLDFHRDDGMCACAPELPVPLHQGCDPDHSACGPGAVCVPAREPEARTCRQVCLLDDPDGCAHLGHDEGQLYVCSPYVVNEGAPSSHYGLCHPVGPRCSLLHDDCPDFQTCAFVGTQTACTAIGFRDAGQSCDTETRCGRGLLCVHGDDPGQGHCHRVCDPADGSACAPGDRCQELGGTEGGVCVSGT